MTDFIRTAIEDSDRYIEMLRRCDEVPSDCYSALVFGYDAVWSTSRWYSDGMCWQGMEIDGKKVLYPPMGDWENVDWEKAFSNNVEPNTSFKYVPSSLKDLWEKAMPGKFAFTENRNDWDYVYDLHEYYHGDENHRRLCKAFRELYEYKVEPITVDNVDVVRKFNEDADRQIMSKQHGCCEELCNDDKALNRLLDHWDQLKTVEGLLIKTETEYASFIIWDVIDDRVAGLFNKNLYNYKGVQQITIEEFCRVCIEKNRKVVNHCCDAGVESLRVAKNRRKPSKMIEKYDAVYEY